MSPIHKGFKKKSPSEDYLNLLAALRNTNTTLHDLGAKYNLSRERVRQIAEYHGINCRLRRTNRSKELKNQKVFTNPVFCEVWALLKTHGLQASIIRNNYKSILVEGMTCSISHVKRVTSTNHCSVRLYGRVFISKSGPQIIVFDNPFEGGDRSFYIFSHLPAGTYLSIPANKEVSRFRIRHNLIDRSSNKDAWHLLKER